MDALHRCCPVERELMIQFMVDNLVIICLCEYIPGDVVAIGRIVWSVPPTSFIEMNPDGAFWEGRVGAGIIFRDEFGRVVSYRMLCVPLCKLPRHEDAEFEALREGLAAAMRRGTSTLL